MLTIVVCDDKPDEADTVKQLIHSYVTTQGIEAEIKVFDSGEHLVMNYERGEADIVFLDILMGTGMTGIECARALRKKDIDVPIVFATSSVDHALDSYDVQAVHYLVKPLNNEKIASSFERCSKLLASARRTIELTANRSVEHVLVQDIMYAEVFGNRSLVHCKDRELTTYTPLAQLIEELGDSFLRCHRSYLVNMDFIDRAVGREFILSTGDRIPIRTNGRKQVLESYQSYLTKEL